MAKKEVVYTLEVKFKKQRAYSQKILIPLHEVYSGIGVEISEQSAYQKLCRELLMKKVVKTESATVRILELIRGKNDKKES